MKKLASLALALVMCMSLATTAFAAGTPMTVDNVTLSDVVRTEKKTATFQGYRWDDTTYESIPYTEQKDITIYYLSVGSTVDLAPDAEWIPSLTFFTMMEDGTYSAEDGDQIVAPLTVSEWAAEWDLLLLSSSHYSGAFADKELIYFAVDKGQAPAEPEAPTEPATPAEPEQPTQPEAPAAPAEPTTPATPAPAGTYTVKKGDTYGTIALNNYGTYGVWQQLYKANNYAKLTEGAQLVLPETLGKVAKIAAPAATAGETLYTVKAGDTLGAIAKTVYGDVMQYKNIFERNADRLVNANTIYEGQVIVLPAK